MEITPDPLGPDAQMIADHVALAVARAHETGKPCTVRLNTIRLGSDRWQSYEVKFDVPKRCIEVRLGPIVDTGGNPEPGFVPSKKPASAPLPCMVRLDYQAATRVDILDGPTFRMVPDEQGSVTPEFIPWHRRWSHSLVIAFVLALAGTVIWGPLAGGVIFAAQALHILADQLGYMGSNLFYPFTSKRAPGLRRMHSSHALTNFGAVWLSCLLIFWNLYARSSLCVPGFNPLKILVFAGIIPFALLGLMKRIRARKA